MNRLRRTADMVWAEPLFTVLVLGFVLLLEDGCRPGGTRCSQPPACSAPSCEKLPSSARIYFAWFGAAAPQASGSGTDAAASLGEVERLRDGALIAVACAD